jgi:uncharacterized damage-inducible protein DinB
MRDIERESALSDLEGTRVALLRTLEEIPEERFFAAPAEGCWSPAATLEHVVFVEGRALGRIRSALQKAVDPSRKSAMEGRDAELIGQVRSREARVQAPAMAHPTGGKPRADLVAAFVTARDATMQFARETDGDLRSHFATHPLLGDLDCYQWLMLIPSHCERHRKQIEECRP